MQKNTVLRTLDFAKALDDVEALAVVEENLKAHVAAVKLQNAARAKVAKTETENRRRLKRELQLEENRAATRIQASFKPWPGCA